MLCFRNIVALLNAFELAESDITDSSYDQVVQRLNETYPDIIQGLDLKTCNLDTFLSEVRFSPSLCLMRNVYYKSYLTLLCCNTVLFLGLGSGGDWFSLHCVH